MLRLLRETNTIYSLDVVVALPFWIGDVMMASTAYLWSFNWFMNRSTASFFFFLFLPDIFDRLCRFVCIYFCKFYIHKLGTFYSKLIRPGSNIPLDSQPIIWHSIDTTIKRVHEKESPPICDREMEDLPSRLNCYIPLWAIFYSLFWKFNLYWNLH